MYIQFLDRLNAHTHSPGFREWLSGALFRSARFLIQQYHHRKATRLLAELDYRLRLDIGRADAASQPPSAMASQDPRVLAFGMQLLRGP